MSTGDSDRAQTSNAVAPAAGSTDDPAAAPTVIIGIVGINLLIATVLLVTVVFERESNEEALGKADVAIPALETYRADQSALLGTYDWIDKDENIVTIPIERAVEIVAAELNENAAPESP